MSATATRVPRLPTLNDIEEADNKLGSFMSSLDWFTSEAEAIDKGREIPLDVAAAMIRNNVEFEDSFPYEHDDKTFARLLVFADELLNDAESIERDAHRLRQALLGIYLHQVNPGGEVARGGGLDA